jgi:hypothetical protein
MTMNNDDRKDDANRDPLTGAPGSHPVGTGIGAVVGAVVGGLAGKGVAESIDPTREHAYWSENFSGRDYVEKGSSFDDYGPAYDYGVDARGQYPGRGFDDVESDLSRDWSTRRGASILSWEWAELAARDAWNRTRQSS